MSFSSSWLARAVLSVLVSVAASGCATHCKTSGISLPEKTAFRKLTFRGTTGYNYPVYRTARNGPPVLVLHELNGLSAAPLDFSLELATHGWTVYAPALFEDYGYDRPLSALGKLKRNCRWKLDDKNDSGPVLGDVAGMTDWISRLHGGQRVIVMGNCLTGNFPVALLARRSVKVGVVCQPAFPLANLPEVLFHIQPAEEKEAWAVPPKDFDAAVSVLKGREKRLLGFHYLQDPLAPFEKFEALHRRLAAVGAGHQFRPVVLRSRALASGDQPWWRSHDTEVRRSFGGPHNTVTESGSQTDRKAMRSILYGQLERVRSL